ncbi:mannose-6-phosphate isomerase [Kitasatospora sp. NE20-6]|uniref:mannose-6-phosphate isomerase, class I n=1 Tax=Kitasatospora sp. NE20-6 TaxID=2859066 RepID=UPI0034DB8339
MTPAAQPAPGLLANTVRTYAWGSATAIPGLLGTDPTGEPQAELWIGAHPSAPSLLQLPEGPRPLDALIAADPDGQLGAPVAARFGPHLPFLLKVLAADRALSVQVHPTRAQARAGYDDEDARGIPPGADRRIYKDRNHKPEMLCALSDFDALCGFRDPAATAGLLDALDVDALTPWITDLRTRPAPDALRAVLTGALGSDRDRGRAAADALALALPRAAAGGGPHGAAYAAYAAAARDYPGDPGIVAALLLNHVRLAPGQALHLDAGVPHAYLRGLGVEIMANSDNVLRCGLTGKHIDLDALVGVVDFRPAPAGIVEPLPAGPGEMHYPAPAEEFRLDRLDLDGTRTCDGPGPQILLCTTGEATLTCPGSRPLTLTPGAAAYLPAAAPPAVLHGSATLYRATVPATVPAPARP